jgi:hypothetical protein
MPGLTNNAGRPVCETLWGAAVAASSPRKSKGRPTGGLGSNADSQPEKVGC